MNLPEQATQPSDPSYRTIYLSKGKFALVDIKDFDSISSFKWCASWARSTNSFYAVRQEAVTKKRIYMHRQIMGFPNGLDVDHINHDTLDNRRENLRSATRSQNNCNAPLRRLGKSGVRGVIWCGQRSQWVVTITFNKKKTHCGFFDDVEAAKKVYEREVAIIHGAFRPSLEKL